MTVRIFVIASTLAIVVVGRQLLIENAEAHTAHFSPAPIATVKAMQIRQEIVQYGIRYAGVVKEFHKVELAFRVAGTIQSFAKAKAVDGSDRYIHEGDVLPKNTVLAQLDTADLERDRQIAADKLAAAQARLAHAKSEKQLAVQEEARGRRLRDSNSISLSEYDKQVTQKEVTSASLAAAVSEVDALRVQLQQAEANLEYCAIQAPFASTTIAARYVDAGERIGAHQKALLVYDLSKVLVSFGVPDKVVAQLAIGKPLQVFSDAIADQSFHGVVHKIDAKPDAVTKAYNCEVLIDAPGGLKPGMAVSILWKKDVSGLLVPLTSVHSQADSKGYAVFKIVDDNDKSRIESIPVDVQSIVDNRALIQPSNANARGLRLHVDDRIVLSGVHRLLDGQIVEIAN